MIGQDRWAGFCRAPKWDIKHTKTMCETGATRCSQPQNYDIDIAKFGIGEAGS